MSKFVLEINLGNDAMIGADDIGYALIFTGRQIQSTGKTDIGKVRDTNGNIVGYYKVVGETGRIIEVD